MPKNKNNIKKKRNESARQVAMKDITEASSKNYVYLKDEIAQLCEYPKITMDFNFN
jgi:hypothetical protein